MKNKKTNGLIMFVLMLGMLGVSNLGFAFQPVQPARAPSSSITLQFIIYRIELADDGDGGCGWWPEWETCGQGELYFHSRSRSSDYRESDVQDAEDYIQYFYPSPTGSNTHTIYEGYTATLSLADADSFGFNTNLIYISIKPIVSGYNSWPCSTCWPIYAYFLEETETGEWFQYVSGGTALFEYKINSRRSGNGHSNGFILAISKQ
ncbi:MAG: hypothetical protein HeimC3_43900 [Candidatus Heimdallarchaeota archaeon LC_3]|nr:MAG: hypothetical protein HeimC3_43900 [Candidatus Heimdallarchaeota archaeon LC_3]